MVLYATMIVWSLPLISAAAGGLAPFDLRPGGYSLADAQTFLAALSPEGAALYKGAQHLLDVFYPPLMSLTLFFGIAALAPKALGRGRWLLAAPALLIAICDLTENYFVGLMLDAGAADLTDSLVGTASLATVTKSGISALVMLVLLGLLLRRGWLYASSRWSGRSGAAT